MAMEPGTSPTGKSLPFPLTFSRCSKKPRKHFERISKMDLEGVMTAISGAGNSINSLVSSQELRRGAGFDQ